MEGTAAFLTKYSPTGDNVVFEATGGESFDLFFDLSCNHATGTCYTTGAYFGIMTIQGNTFITNEFPQYFVATFDADGDFLGLINGTGRAIGGALQFRNDDLWVSGLFLQSLMLGPFDLSSSAQAFSLFTVRYT